MKRKSHELDDDLRPEYDLDFSKGERGKYYKRLLKEGSNVVALDPDVLKAFPDSTAVNTALRSLLGLAQVSAGLTSRSRRTRQKTPRRST
ncbi:MAG: hypothetical protein M3436_02985 [Pseudomonadota bacterium]|nr:hypothetical protein [Pseudomonadota bacterium]